MKYFIANWKTYLKQREALALAKACRVARAAMKPAKAVKQLRMVIAPSDLHLAAVAKVLGTSVAVAAQDAGMQGYGPGTGETNILEAKALGATYALIGHSERRQAGETGTQISAKFVAALKSGLIPVLCVGETAEERLDGKALDVVLDQVESAVKAAGKLLESKKFLIAYEPVWAIGTGDSAQFTDVAEMHLIIRKQLQMHIGDVGATVPILYGGSVTAETVAQYASLPAVDGVLVGSASTKSNELKAMLKQLLAVCS